MKRIYFIILTIIIPLSSCDYGDLNVDPNSPTSAPLPSLLSSSEAVLSYTIGGDISELTNTITQHVGGVNLQAAAWDKYNIDAEAGNSFNTLYNGVMLDLVTLISLSKEASANHYTGMAKILLATSLGVATDLYGDIPYSEAFQGSVNPYPKFDSQEEIYIEIYKLLDEGIAALRQETSLLSPGSDDLIYKGDLDKWIAAAYTLKSRYILHMTKIDETATSQEVLNTLFVNGAVYRGIADNSSDFEFVFGSGATEANPWHQHVQGRNDFRMGKKFVDLMLTSPVDPRLRFYADPTSSGGYAGGPAGQVQSSHSQLGPYYASPSSPVPLITFVEAKFIEAEARLRIDENDQRAQIAFQDAVRASLEKVGKGTIPQSEIENYINSNGIFSGSFNEKLEQLITQKYIALFTQPEVWVDWRRTNYPALSPAFGGVNGLNLNGDIPRRFPVPLNERISNPNAPQGTPNLQTPRLFWDK